ncbi:MAG: ABC transporter ATP-binding protein [Deltaproteobacteria bacterium]|nr:ABC transporter ATP-binding protein [Deltaproteobacteria bacterium]
MIFKAQEIDFWIEEKKILSNISLNIGSGSFTALLGPNGAGKSTLLKIFSRVLEPSQGKLFFEDKEINSVSLRDFSKNVSYLPQNFHFPFAIQVLDLVLLGRTPHQNFLTFNNQKDLYISISALKKTGVEHLQDRYFQTLSGGEKQKVLLAKCLAQETKVLCLDEPTTFLDLKHQIEFSDLLKKLKSENNFTVILATHDLSFLKNCCDHTVFLKQGEVVQYGNTKELLTTSNIAKLFDLPKASLKGFPLEEYPH